MKRYQVFIFLVVILSVISLFVEQIPDKSYVLIVVGHFVDFLLMGIVLIETVYEIVKAKSKALYVKENVFSLLFVVIFFVLFIYSKFFISRIITTELAIFAILIRNIFTALKIYSRMKKLSAYVDNFTSNPAQSILISFIFVILIGTLLLMMNFTTIDNRGLPLLDALFTATSATCVTGLIVVDTAVTYTIWGQLIILALIQIGGLGIMLLSFFTAFLLGKRISLQDKMLLSYMLSEDDTSNLKKTVLGIVLLTLIIETIGAASLFFGFIPTLGISFKNVYYSIFHSVSAFCNAGFALFSTSLEEFRFNPIIIFTISLLIILGGIGFSVIINVINVTKERLKYFKNKKIIPRFKNELTLNSKIVLTTTAFLLISGTLLFYILEHNNSMKNFSLGEQYLSAFFQSVTLRTAGFNSVSFSSFLPPTYIFMCVFMFIGAGSGGTAGGVKIGTITVINATIKSFFKGQNSIRIRKFQIPNQKARVAFIVLFSGLFVALTALFLLSITENKNIIEIAFEIFSAIGTVGLSTGLTPYLTAFGKIIISLLMFWGRVGALTILSSTAYNKENVNIKWPQAEIAIG